MPLFVLRPLSLAGTNTASKAWKTMESCVYVLEGACRVNRVWGTFNLVRWGLSQNEQHAWPAPWEKRVEAHSFINSPSIPGPFSPSHFHLWFQWGFVFGSHELFSALCPSLVGQLRELSKGPGQWQEVLSSKNRERPWGWGWGLP